MVRVLMAGILGGVLVLGGGFLGHSVLELGEDAIQPHMSKEGDVMAAIKSSPPGFYFVPGMDRAKGQTKEEKEKAETDWQQKFKVGPNAIVFRGPDGADFDFWGHLIKEGVSNVIAALLVALAISFVGAGGGFLGRWLACILLGAFAAVSITASYWIWYYMPFDYLKGELFEQLLEWALGGLAIAAIVKPRRPT